MQIKIIDGFVQDYEDISLDKLYEVVDEREYFYVVIDDMFDRNRIDKKHCEIITEEDVFKKGDRVKIAVKDASDISLLEGWSLQGKVNMVGEIDEIDTDEEPTYNVNLDNGEAWIVPEQLLQKIPETACDTIEKEEQQTPTPHQIIRFTQNNKGFSVSFEDGNITLADWSNDPNATFYRPKTLEELFELMGLIEKINEYKFDNE